MPPKKRPAKEAVIKEKMDSTDPEPPKRRKLSSYERKLEESNQLEPAIRGIVSRLMFASGDAEDPPQENEDFVVNMLKNELILLFYDVFAVHENTIKSIHLEHVLPLLKTQKRIISRFVKYLENRIEMAAYMKKRVISANGTVENICGQDVEIDSKNDEEGVDEIGDVGGAEGEYLKNKRKKIGITSAEEALLRDVKKKFITARMEIQKYQEYVDTTLDDQKSAVQTVIEDMSGDDYNSYAMARRISFQTHSVVPPIKPDLQPNPRKKKRVVKIPSNCREGLIAWIGSPPISGESALVFIAFLAKEIVWELVSSALIQKRKADPSDFGPLTRRNYEETLRKNKRFRKRSTGRFESTDHAAAEEEKGAESVDEVSICEIPLLFALHLLFFFRIEHVFQMPKQEFDNWDLWAGAICFGLFMAFVLVTSCTCINYCCVRDDDELTKMEIWGAEHKVSLRLGPHTRKTLEKKMAERLIE